MSAGEALLHSANEAGLVDGSGISFGILGPLQVRVADRELELSRSSLRRLLGVLLLTPGKSVDRQQLVELVWGPAGCTPGTLHSAVSRLRGWLHQHAGLEDAIIRVGKGYRIDVPVDSVDADRFRALVRAADRETDARVDLLDSALALWRGSVLSDCLDSTQVSPVAADLERDRIDCAFRLADAALECGRPEAALEHLERLASTLPYDELIHARLITVLGRSGQRAEGLRRYGDIRRRLADELGVDPGAPLRQAHLELLRDQAPLIAPGKASSSRFDASAVPAAVCQLPPDIPDFSGRADSVRELATLLSGGRGTDTAPTTVVIAGPPGVGKSTLALHVAHTVRAAFPDGQLYADLTGTTRSPREPGGLLAEALRALGVTGAAIPKSLSERVALYRTRLADRRVLVVLDDAANAAQVHALLPATAGCAVIATSRHRLAELPGAHPVVLDALRPEEGQELIGRIIGPERTEREPRETAAILAACGYLPLAIRIAGAKLAGRKAWTMRVLQERLTDESQRISELQVGDLGVRAGFEMSMRMLPPDAARAFRLLGMLGAQTFPGWVIDALLDRRSANGALDALLDAHLLQLADVDTTGRPRYRLHDLLRVYAREATANDPPQLRRAALTRVLGGWLALAEQAADHLPATVNRAVPGNAARWRLDPHVAAQLIATPRDWFEAERRSLLSAVTLAADNGLDELAWELAVCLVPYLDHLSLYEDWRCCHEQALPAVRTAGNRRGEAALLRGLGQINIYWDDYERAQRDFARSGEFSQEIGDKQGEAWAVAGLGTVGRMLGRHEYAVGHYLRALTIFAAMEERYLEAQTCNSIGVIRLAQGKIAEARNWLTEALRISRAIGDDFRAAIVLVNVGNLHRLNNEPLRALACQHQALAALEQSGDELRVAYALLAVGETYAVLQDRAMAMSACYRAKATFTRTGDQSGEAACIRLLDKLTGAPLSSDQWLSGR